MRSAHASVLLLVLALGPEFPGTPAGPPLRSTRHACPTGSGWFEYYVDEYSGLTLVGRYVIVPEWFSGEGQAKELKGYPRIAATRQEVLVRDFHNGEQGPYSETVAEPPSLLERGFCAILNPPTYRGDRLKV